MTDGPWDEGAVEELRVERDRAVAAVRQLRAALLGVLECVPAHTPKYNRPLDVGMDALVATAEYDA